MASDSQPSFHLNSSYSHPLPSSSVFYETEVKKDSEIKMRDPEVQHLLNVAMIKKEAEYSQLLSQTPESLPLCLDRLAPVSSTTCTTDTSLNQSDSSIDRIVPADDGNRLSQSDRAHLCLTCFKGFRNKPQLTQHLLVHTNVRKHVCSHCQKSFKQICHLNQHMRVHTGERPYKCDVEECGRSFAQLSNLNHHKKNHEDHVRRDVTRAFRCEVCDRSFSTTSSLNTHMQKLHSGIKATDDSVTKPIQSPTTCASRLGPRKRRIKSEIEDYTLMQEVDIVPSTFVMECDSDDDSDDGLLTKVKVKSTFGLKTNITVRIATPPGNEERDKSKDSLRTSLPLPFTTILSQSSPMLVRYQQRQGQDDFITSFSDSVPQGHGHRELSHHNSTSLYSPNESFRTPNQSFRTPNHPHMHALKQVDDLNDERKLMEALQQSEAALVKQRELMQRAVSQRRAIAGTNKPNFGQMDQPSTRVSPVFVLSSEPLPVFSCRQGQLFSQEDSRDEINLQMNIQSDIPSQGNIRSDIPSTGTVQSDVPSHVAHHYPEPNNTEQDQQIASHSIFNPAFTEQNHNSMHNRYSQSQF